MLVPSLYKVMVAIASFFMIFENWLYLFRFAFILLSFCFHFLFFAFCLSFFPFHFALCFFGFCWFAFFFPIFFLHFLVFFSSFFIFRISKGLSEMVARQAQSDGCSLRHVTIASPELKFWEPVSWTERVEVNYKSNRHPYADCKILPQSGIVRCQSNGRTMLLKPVKSKRCFRGNRRTPTDKKSPQDPKCVLIFTNPKVLECKSIHQGICKTKRHVFLQHSFFRKTRKNRVTGKNSTFCIIRISKRWCNMICIRKMPGSNDLKCTSRRRNLSEHIRAKKDGCGPVEILLIASTRKEHETSKNFNSETQQTEGQILVPCFLYWW